MYFFMIMFILVCTFYKIRSAGAVEFLGKKVDDFIEL